MLTGKTQPIRQVMIGERWSVSRLAEETGVTYTHMRGCVYGWAHPCDHLRQVLPEILGESITNLFDPDVLSRPYAEHYVNGDKRPARVSVNG